VSQWSSIHILVGLIYKTLALRLVFCRGGGAIQKAFLLAVSLFVSTMVMVWIHKTTAIRRQRLFGQFFLLSGALGNLLDRAQYGYVVDFIDVHYQNYYWPVFNVADGFIFIGVILLLFERRQPSL